MIMSRILPASALVVLVVLSGLLIPSAGATEWHTNGDKSFTSTNAGGVYVIFHSSNGFALTTCSGTQLSGTLNGPTGPTAVWPSAATVTPVFTGCQVTAFGHYTIACSPAELGANSYVGGTTPATAGGGITTATLTSIDCRVSQADTTCSTLTGSLVARYTNPTPIFTGSGTLTVTGIQGLTGHRIGPGCQVLNGFTTIGTPGAGTSITPLNYSIDGPNAPYLFRTP